MAELTTDTFERIIRVDVGTRPKRMAELRLRICQRLMFELMCGLAWTDVDPLGT